MSDRRITRRNSQMQYKPMSSQPGMKSGNKVSVAKILRLTLVVTAILVLLYVFTASPLLRINTIEVAGLKTLSEDSIRSQVQDVINSSLINQNILFVPMGQINTQLKKDNYQIANAEIIRIPFNTIKVTVTEQKPSILWRSGNTLSILTGDGRAYAGEPNDELKNNLPTVVDSTNLPVKAGEKIVSESFANFVTQLHTTLPDKNIKATQFEVQETTTELFVTTADGYKLRFDTTRPVDEQITDLATVLDQLKKQGKKPTEYIDLRINGKVFYK